MLKKEKNVWKGGFVKKLYEFWKYPNNLKQKRLKIVQKIQSNVRKKREEKKK